MNGPDACLQLDVGNGSTKWRLVAGGDILARGTYREDDAATERELLGAAPDPLRIWIASVAAPHSRGGIACAACDSLGCRALVRAQRV